MAIILITALLIGITACNSGSNDENEVIESPFASAGIGDVIQFGEFDWRVLDVQDGKALILADRIVENQQYHDNVAITWEDSEVRKWLNDTFLKETFTAAERNLIAESWVVNNDNPEYGTAGGNDTTDRIFLLSFDEAEKYFPDETERIALDFNNTPSFWWLRSPGAIANSAVGVSSVDGGIGEAGILLNSSYGIRPALWVNM